MFVFPMSIPGPGQCLFHFPEASLGVPLNAEGPDRSTAQGLGLGILNTQDGPPQ